MKQEYHLKEYYINYLRSIRHLSDSSIKHYVGGLSTIDKLLVAKSKVHRSIYEINSMQDLLVIREHLKSDVEFLLKDSTGHNMYSAALNNYIRFAQGDDFFTEAYSLKDIDKPMKVAEMQIVDGYQYRRSSIVKQQAIKAAHFMCESDNKHITFTAKSNKAQYMEGHHLIPLKDQGEFKYSLDIYANIVSLCPLCHRLLHFGVEKEKRALLEELYKDRYVRLCNSGIEINKSDFLELTI